ncbi:UDP-2,4-diacetamido-2,4,6-trideoxy-beta-L-altropyranose hydrolase [Denitromonas sp.]|uniref:UDP-2,4-diacetamido-2,4, 6-trideoxy-beta-L-altropyranose hydrolase n=1 Tax=Denitromonas sp. TaxID=2734609 RepID=UPI002B9C1FD6|nr:UDP-2,4-diacetamido-2,4,6-trideoxy-beta-L-altropyranose hydrolase [Denitromonas sp.]
MHVVFRVDASVAIGTGHLMRCLTLADAMKPQNIQVTFVCRKSPGSMVELIGCRGYQCVCLDGPIGSVEADAEETTAALLSSFAGGVCWLVVDHYGLDARWEALMRPIARKIMVIDDLANRAHDCDLLLDQNFYAGFESRYVGRVADSTRCLLGPAHVLLRPEFLEACRTLRRRDGTVRRILVFFGGSDPTNQTLRVLTGIDALQRPDIRVDAVVGSANPHREDVRAFCDARPWASFHCQILNMAELIAAADLGVGAGGAAMWERCALGLPTLTVVFVDNQLQTTQDVATTGAIAYLGWASNLSSADYAAAIRGLLDRPDELVSISTEALKLIDASNDGAELVIRAMNEITNARLSG